MNIFASHPRASTSWKRVAVAVLAIAFAGAAARLEAQDAATTDGTVSVKETDWCTVTAPVEVSGDAEATAEIAIKGDAIKEDSVLYVDLHKFVGKTRIPGAGRAAPVQLKAGEAYTATPALEIPDDARAVSFVIYVVPAGKSGWADKTHNTEVGIKVQR